MKFIFNRTSLPYRIDGEKADEYYSRVKIFAWEIFSIGSLFLKELLGNTEAETHLTESQQKSTLMELLLIGIMLKSHSQQASGDIETIFSETTEIIDSDSEQTTSSTLSDYTLTDLNDLIDYLRITGEYPYEIPVLESWIARWTAKESASFSVDIRRILVFAEFFTDYAERYIGKFFDRHFFNSTIPAIETDREDYFQVTKTLPEYFLNAVAAQWMNEINRESFDSKKVKTVMAPGCMRPANGIYCKAEKTGAFLNCTGCNMACNINRLRLKGKEQNFEVRIVLHQSTFKADKDQLKDDGIVGVACMSCLLSGGLMLRQKGIDAMCVMLKNPGCNKHWTDAGLETDISYPELLELMGKIEDNRLENKLSA